MIYTQETPNLLNVFISAARADKDLHENNMRHLQLIDRVKALWLNFDDIYIGCYKEDGQEVATTELTLGLTISPDNLDKLHELSNHFEQDCILVSNTVTHTSYLLFKDGSKEDIGTMTKVRKEEIKGNAYTFNFVSGEYWECLQ